MPRYLRCLSKSGSLTEDGRPRDDSATFMRDSRELPIESEYAVSYDVGQRSNTLLA